MKKQAKNLLLITIIILGLVGCGQPDVQLKPLKQDAVILAFGDSLTFGTGAQPGQSYPSVLAELTDREVINAGIPGELSSAGKTRLSQLLQETNPDLVILCHGGNDLLRKLSRQQLQANLQAMVDEITDSGAQVLLVAVPTFAINLTPAPLYLEVAQNNNIPIQPTILSELLVDNALKADQVHPNALGYRQFAQSIHHLLIESGAISQ
jgi:acyl-CoA thioesterase I